MTLPLACGSVDLRPPASRDLCPTVLRRSDGAPTRSIASSSAMDSTNMPSSTMRCSSWFSSPLDTAHDHFRSTCSRRASPRQCRCKLVTAVCWRGDSAGGSPPATVLMVGDGGEDKFGAPPPGVQVTDSRNNGQVSLILHGGRHTGRVGLGEFVRSSQAPIVRELNSTVTVCAGAQGILCCYLRSKMLGR